MPIYEYACPECGRRTEVRQSFSDPPLTICERCGGKLRRVIHPVGVVFRGSGFYSTDHRKGAGGKEGKEKVPAGDKDGKPESKGQSKAESTAASKPAEGSSGGDAPKVAKSAAHKTD